MIDMGVTEAWEVLDVWQRATGLVLTADQRQRFFAQALVGDLCAWTDQILEEAAFHVVRLPGTPGARLPLDLWAAACPEVSHDLRRRAASEPSPQQSVESPRSRRRADSDRVVDVLSAEVMDYLELKPADPAEGRRGKQVSRLVAVDPLTSGYWASVYPPTNARACESWEYDELSPEEAAMHYTRREEPS